MRFLDSQSGALEADLRGPHTVGMTATITGSNTVLKDPVTPEQLASFTKGMSWSTTPPKHSIVALIPARAGSKRVPRKNFRPLNGVALIEYTFTAAKEAGIFQHIIVSTDAEEIEVPEGILVLSRPKEMALDDSPDILWVKHVLRDISADAFAILRPTNPFRSPAMIVRGWEHFLCNQPADSLRAVQLVKQHPGKMWVLKGNRIQPLFPFWGPEAPWHSMPTQSLPQVCVQNASLEIAWTKTVKEQGSISGATVIPFFPMGNEGFNIDTEQDWDKAEEIAKCP